MFQIAYSNIYFISHYYFKEPKNEIKWPHVTHIIQSIFDSTMVIFSCNLIKILVVFPINWMLRVIAGSQ